MNKVFCKGCHFYDKYGLKGASLKITLPKNFDCLHEKNIMITKKIDWFEEETIKTTIKKPKKINSHNNCEWYKKEEIFST